MSELPADKKLRPPRKSVELEDSGAHDLGTYECNPHLLTPG